MSKKELFGNSEQLNPEAHIEHTKTHACDCISRQAAIDAIEGVDWYHINKNGEMVHGANPDEHQAWYKAEDIYKAVESVPSAQRWISCEERLPKDYESVNVTVRIPEGRYVKESAFLNGVWIGVSAPAEVVAWCPLPEPYREDTP